jgi:hypothetical protein
MSVNARFRAIRRKAKAIGRRAVRWIRYLYFMRFSILLWAFPLVLIWANSPSTARSLVSGIVTPVRWSQYLCVAFFLFSSSFVALILARIVVINGTERFGDAPPECLEKLLADNRARHEWLAPVLSQLNTVIVVIYFFINGSTESVDWKPIALGVVAGGILAFLFWYVVNAIYYLSYPSTGSSAGAEAGFGYAAARTILLPRKWMLLSRDGKGDGKGDALENAHLGPGVHKLLGWIARIFPIPGYRRAPNGDLYEGHYFALVATAGFFVLYWEMYPLTAPVPTVTWSAAVLIVYLILSLALILAVVRAEPGEDADAHRLRIWKGILVSAISAFSVSIPLLYWLSDAERFPVLALILILVISSVWTLGAIAFFADRYRIPVLTIILLLVVIPRRFNVYGGNEEHYFSIALRDAQFSPPTPAKILEQKLQDKASADEPFIVVTSTGGGIHAAAWTTAVLGQLEEQFAHSGLGSFHEHVLLLSTVSGGSSGLYDYLRELDPNTVGGNFEWQRMRTRAECSSLEAVGWGLVYYDIPKAFVPLAPYVWPRSTGVDDLNESPWSWWSHVPLGKDRTWALRRAFARNLDDPYCRPGSSPSSWIKLSDEVHAQQNNEKNLAELALANLDPTETSIPAFTMNTTTVEGGDRFLLANYQIPYYAPPQYDPLTPQPAESFPQVYGATQLVQNDRTRYPDLPLATAAQLSATFPLVSSAATFPAVQSMQGAHYVDGGYYDNDGTASAIEFLRAAVDGLPSGAPLVRIVLVEIRNSPDSPSSQTCCAAWFADRCADPWNLIGQLLAPLGAFYAAGHQSVTGRNRVDLNLFEQAYQGKVKVLQHIVIDDEGSMADVKTDPLNWSLTPAQQTEVVRSAMSAANKKNYCQVVKVLDPDRKCS